MVSPSPILENRDANEALNQIRLRSKNYKLFVDYYEGHHDLAFATTKWRNAFGNLFRQFRDNLCAPIVDAAADRLTITGFQIPDNPPVQEEIWDLWTRARMDRKSGELHEHILKAGDAYLIVWKDARTGELEVTPNPAHQIYVKYSDSDDQLILWAAKLWRLDDGRWRLTMYYPDAIQKYVSISKIDMMPEKFRGVFTPWMVPGEIWPLPNPYDKVPVFHFANKPEMGLWGQSELYNVIPLQDALNKSVADMLVAMEYVSLPQRWVTGIEFDEDPVTGKPKIPFEAGVDRIWSTENDAARFGQFEGSGFSEFTKVQNDFRLEMARISRTPLHYLSIGGPSEGAFVSSMYPSGESLKTAEAPFIAKLRDRQVSFGDVWEEVVSFMTQLTGVADITSTDIETQWESPAPRSLQDDLNHADMKMNKLGIPREIVWAELGYSDQQIDEMKRLAPPPVQGGSSSAFEEGQQPQNNREQYQNGTTRGQTTQTSRGNRA